ncbi:hypothetical protein [Novosphingobium panipatense]|uniref:hypothetical protein n=1 Tax=Novosphingobium panipatense TaxID=428991 RepID=UPI003610D315
MLRNGALGGILNTGQHEIGDAAPFQRRRVLDQRLLLRRHARFQSLASPANWGRFPSLCVGHSFLLSFRDVRPIAGKFKMGLSSFRVTAAGIVISATLERGGEAQGVRGAILYRLYIAMLSICRHSAIRKTYRERPFGHGSISA